MSAVPNALPVLALAAALLAGCVSSEPAPPAPLPATPRGEAVAQMRAKAAASEAAAYPTAFSADTGPSFDSLHSVTEVAEIEARLSALAASRSGGSAGEAEAATQRAELLRRLAEARRREAEEAIASGAALQ